MKQIFSSQFTVILFKGLFCSGLLGFVLVCFNLSTQIVPAEAQESQVLEKQQEKSTEHIVFLIEEDAVLPTQFFGKFKGNADEIKNSNPVRFLKSEELTLPNQRALRSTMDLNFSLSGGGASFEETRGRQMTATTQSGIISTPIIRAGAVYDVDFLTVMVEGQVIIESLRVATLPIGSIQKLLEYVPTGDPALITYGDSYAVIDDSKLSIETDEAVTGDEFRLQEDSEKSQRRAASRMLSLCIRPIWEWHGIIKWQISDPKGAGYSYKLEGPNELAWASAPQNYIDGIYNKRWGCNRALKIPTHCTVNWYSGSVDWYSASYSYCCNISGILAGKGVPRWVTPGGGGEANSWVACPLR